jgi:Transcriptional regulatory protein, C terminal/WD40-like Beta Propeller Repeat
LVQHYGRLVTKSALIESVWPDASVTDNSLAQCLLEIRRALTDDSQQLIHTVKGRGYTFAAPVTTRVVEFPRKPGGAQSQPGPLPAHPPSPAWTSRSLLIIGGIFVGLALAAGGLLLLWRTPPARHEATYEQITNFPDSTLAPALSPDGRMVAFYRSDSWFLTPDQIYVKMLPGGEPAQLTHDPKWKYGLAFSPDGSRIAYTVSEGGPSGWQTFTVPVLGGEPSLLLANAAGLSWLDQRQLLFSEIRKGEHMGFVTATASRSEYRQIYFPKNERGMVHSSYVSPDRKWALVTENGSRLASLPPDSTGRELGRQAGRAGRRLLLGGVVAGW